MNKILTILLFIFAFNMSAIAQDKVPTLESIPLDFNASADKDIADLEKVVKTSPEFKIDLKTLFVMRSEAVANSNSAEEKKMLFEIFGKKLMSGLSPEQLATFKKSSELFKRLTQYSN